MYSYSFTERLRIYLSRIAAIIFLIIILFTSSKWEEISFTSSVFFLIGCILVGIASLGRLWCSLYIAGYKNDTLVTLGPYSISRNPLYFFSLIGAAGVGLATETLLIPLALILLFVIYYPSVIRSEEKRLLNVHGAKYEEYCNKTPSFFPKISLLNEPESCIVNPRIFRKNILGALWFVWLVGILELFEAFHETTILPIYLNIY
jgi:protein-S-isoprenylcysteine O-methyltransferase Ste14